MLTLRFESHDGNNFEVMSCESYHYNSEYSREELASERADGTMVNIPLHKVIRIFRSLNDETPRYEHVGPTEPYKVCYAMNANGKTVDVIR